MRLRKHFLLLLGFIIVICLFQFQPVEGDEKGTADAAISEGSVCSADWTESDPHLHQVQVKLNDDDPDEEETVWMYTPPVDDLTSYYFPDAITADDNETSSSSSPSTDSSVMRPVTPKAGGLSAKFINLSNKNLNLYWEPSNPGAGTQDVLMRQMPPFSCYGTASHIRHKWYVQDASTKEVLQRWKVIAYPNNIYYYDPFEVIDDKKKMTAAYGKVLVSRLKAFDDLTPAERQKHKNWRKVLNYNDIYKKATGRSYLGNYPIRKPPIHKMWRADYFGQQHWVRTAQTHFVTPLPDQGRIEYQDDDESDEPIVLLPEYRDSSASILQLNMTVLSVAPRVFEIHNFLSEVEVQHILDLAMMETLGISSTGALEDKAAQESMKSALRNTRTSRNSWLDRRKSPIVDAIYRRAADVMQIPEALLRQRTKKSASMFSFQQSSSKEPSRFDHVPSDRALAEKLQLVHYDPRQEYTAHHDFGYIRLSQSDEHQPARFATLLLYLNDVPVGGATSFPRWQNAYHFDELQVQPRQGKAVLFYNQLPDGNLDDLSQHAAKPVYEGEKWLINLWTWDPMYE